MWAGSLLRVSSHEGRVLIRLFDPQLFTRDDGCGKTCQEHYFSITFHALEDVIVAKVNIKPLEDKLLVQIVEAETTTASGLVIPDTAKEKPQEATVVAVGPGRTDDTGKRVPMDVAEGDVVIFSKYGGTEIKYAGEDYLILSQRDILAVVEK